MKFQHSFADFVLNTNVWRVYFWQYFKCVEEGPFVKFLTFLSHTEGPLNPSNDLKQELLAEIQGPFVPTICFWAELDQFVKSV